MFNFWVMKTLPNAQNLNEVTVCFLTTVKEGHIGAL